MSNKKSIVFSVLMGMALGVGMALVMLWSCKINNFVYTNISFVCLLVIACALPECTNRLQKRGFLLQWMKPVMIGLSFIICLLYCVAVTKDVGYVSSAFTDMCITTAILHVVSMVFCVLRLRNIK